MTQSKLSGTWLKILKDEIYKTYFQNLMKLVDEERRRCSVFPNRALVFDAFRLTPFEDVKVVLMGQDPYHGPGQAHGLSFSVPSGIKLPPSLRNILLELKREFPKSDFQSGNLEKWAEQGVFLINSVLTVRQKEPASHQKIGWETFTDETITQLSEKREHLVFLLWGKHAQSKSSLINSEKHLVLKAPHPSPFSAHKGFFGCNHFTKTNDYLAQHKIEPIDWSLPPD
jgi:uracil-DNA glycosylase